ncbi:hypothetical protein ACT3HK_14730 [Thermolongibacillus altinsuensis]
MTRTYGSVGGAWVFHAPTLFVRQVTAPQPIDLKDWILTLIDADRQFIPPLTTLLQREALYFLHISTMPLPCTENIIFRRIIPLSSPVPYQIFSEKETSRTGSPGRHIYDSYAAGCFFTCFNGFVSGTAFDQRQAPVLITGSKFPLPFSPVFLVWKEFDPLSIPFPLIFLS